MLLFLLETTILSYVLIQLIIKYAHTMSLIDIPNDRSLHKEIIPRGAGVGFVFSMILSVGLYDFTMFVSYWYVFVSIVIVFIVGIIDDIYDVQPKTKFITIFMATTLLWWYGISIGTLGSYVGMEFNLGWFSLPFSVIALAGFTNALNLIDGMDGLAGSISIIILWFFAYIGYLHGDTLMTILSVFTIASLLGFLVLNWYPAKIFMGDSGSLALGFIISVLAVLSLKHIHPVIILYLTAIPSLDTLVVMLRRIRKGKSPFSPDLTHMHHLLLKFIEKKLDGKTISAEKITVILIVLTQVIFSFIGIILNEYIKAYPELTSFFALIFFGILFLLTYIVFTSIKKRMETKL